MLTHDFAQHTPEWIAHRAAHDNASDAPTMMGESPYQTRTEFLHGRFTGIAQEFDAATQRRFDDGHRFEALARELAEAIIGQGLSPVIGSQEDGRLSASFDGITMDDSVNWEHKTLNDAIRAAIEAADLPVYLRIQMEQQLLVSGAERCLFSATKWDQDGSLLEEKHLWYSPDLELRARIVAGWEQFHKDLAAYVPPEYIPASIAAPIRDLPTITYKMHGTSLSTNLNEDVRPAILALVEQSKRPLETDQDFADLDALCKKFKLAEDQCELVKNQAVGEIKDVAAFGRDLQELADLMRQARLTGEKAVKTEKESRKATMVAKANSDYADHVAGLQTEITGIRLHSLLKAPDFGLAVKGLKSLTSMQDALDNALANEGKVKADAAAKDVRDKLAWCKTEADGMSMLFPDLQAIIGMEMEAFKAVIKNRIHEHRQAEAVKLEAQRKQIQAEEEAKALAKVKAEQEAAAKPVEQAKPAAVEPAPAPAPSVETLVRAIRATRPSVEELVNLVALSYHVHVDVALAWLAESDFSGAVEQRVK